MKELIRVITTSDGSHTIYVPELDEHFHSIHGAVQESAHIFIKNGFDHCRADPIHIFEVGFGTGLNALLTAVSCINGEREVFYTTVEKYPLDEKITRSLNYHLYAGKNGKNIFSLIHSAEWGQMHKICRNFNFRKIKCDLITDLVTGTYDLIYFDAFGPDKQAEMWTKEIFEKIKVITLTDSLFVTYSAKGEVKRKLRAAGFNVSLIPGPPGKRQMIRAIKI